MRMSSLNLITAATVYAVTREDVKHRLRVDSTDDDALFDTLISSATSFVENYTSRSLITSTWKLTLDAFPGKSDDYTIEINRVPLISVSSLTYIDADGAQQTLSTSVYDVDTTSEPARIGRAYGQVWPSIQPGMNRVEVNFTAGYGAAATDVPNIAKEALHLVIEHMWDNESQLPTFDGHKGTALKQMLDQLVWNPLQ